METAELAETPRKPGTHSTGVLEWALLLSVVTLIGQLLAPPLYRWQRGPRIGGQGVVEFSASRSSGCLAAETLVYLPPDYRSDPTGSPLLLYLHGAGGRGSDIHLITRRGLPKFLNEGLDYPMLVVSPQCLPRQTWLSEDLILLLDEATERYHVDPARILVLGESMGGYGAWSLAAAHPERIAAVVPLCGGGDARAADRLIAVPIWAFHGDRDQVVPPSASREMAAAVEEAGGTVRLTILKNTGHDLGRIPLRSDVIGWLLEQRIHKNWRAIQKPLATKPKK